MRSKTFYSKFWKASFVKQLRLMGLNTFAYFLVLLLPLAVMINNWQDGTVYTAQIKMRHYSQFMLQADGAYVLLVAVAAVTALIQFSYLHSRKQMDFYGSLPIKKEVLFSQRVLFSYLDFVIPYTLILLICVVVGLVHGIVPDGLVVNVVEMWVVNQIGFLLILLTCSLAILLTGRKWVGALGCSVFLFGGHILYMVFDSLNSTYFSTYYNTSSEGGVFWLSPVYVLYRLRDLIFELEESGRWISGRYIGISLAVLFVTALLYLLNRYTVKKRASEKAGQSMAFSIPARVLHILLSVVGGLLIGMMTMTFIYVNETVWFFMGSICGTLFLYVVVQFIYTLDIRRTFTYKWQILAAEVLVVLLCGIYSFDLLGYDQYLPKQEKIESVALRFKDDNAHTNYYLNGLYYDGISYAFKEMELIADDDIYAMIEDAVQDTAAGKSLNSLYVRYRLKNGRVVDRAYQVSLEEHKDTLEHLYEQEAFRSMMIPTMRDDTMENMTYEELSVYYGGEYHVLYDIDQPEGIPGFLDIYTTEMKNLKASVFVYSTPIAKLSAFAVGDGGKYGTSLELPVYPECVQTLALLKQRGHDPVDPFMSERIQRIEITDWATNEDTTVLIEDWEGKYQVATKEEAMEQTYTITDKASIEVILEHMVDDSYHVLWQPIESRYEIRVYLNNRVDNEEISYFGFFKEGEVPVEVLEDSLKSVVY